MQRQSHPSLFRPVPLVAETAPQHDTAREAVGVLGVESLTWTSPKMPLLVVKAKLDLACLYGGSKFPPILMRAQLHIGQETMVFPAVSCF